eukprot:11805068-Heterocapsa_arctica.AAC.1
MSQAIAQHEMQGVVQGASLVTGALANDLDVGFRFCLTLGPTLGLGLWLPGVFLRGGGEVLEHRRHHQLPP